MTKSRWIKTAAAGTVSLLIVCATYSGYGDSALFINPGLLVNTSGDDYSPSCTSDGKTIVFSSRSEVESSHKIYTCTNTDGTWSEPRPVLEVSSESNDETPFISADGQILLFSSDRPGGFSPSATADNNKRITFDIYMSRRLNGQWTTPELAAGDVNTNMNERSPSLSPDGRTLFFTRFPYRNISKSVIYMASWDGSRFVDVRPLPESINSGNYEFSFIPSYRKPGVYHFSSRRSGGYGGWDIYSTTMSEKGFSNPVNAGSGINSRFDDLYFNETGQLSIFCSNRTGGFGGYDIYASGAVRAKSTEPSSVIKLSVKDRTGKIIPEAEVRIYRQTSAAEDEQGGRWENLVCDKRGKLIIKTGAGERWIMIKPAGRTFTGKTVRVKITAGSTQDVELIVDNASDSVTDKHQGGRQDTSKTDSGDGSVKSVQSGDTGCGSLPELKPVYFGFNSAEIKTEYVPVLHGIIYYMRRNPEINVIIRGHADRRGAKRTNYAISRLRAERVSQYMISMGIDGSRIKTIPLGETDPQIHGGKYDDALNRRVEFEFANRNLNGPVK